MSKELDDAIDAVILGLRDLLGRMPTEDEVYDFVFKRDNNESKEN